MAIRARGPGDALSKGRWRPDFGKKGGFPGVPCEAGTRFFATHLRIVLSVNCSFTLPAAEDTTRTAHEAVRAWGRTCRLRPPAGLVAGFRWGLRVSPSTSGALFRLRRVVRRQLMVGLPGGGGLKVCSESR